LADEGEIKVFGHDMNLDSNKLNEIRIGFISKCSTYDSMTVKQNLAFTLKRHATDLTRRNRKRNRNCLRKCRIGASHK
jgi:phospholipid/cholesterol/gamma-HCH transport system ATP-binding protein